jgi:hypothetical protein
MSVSFAAPADAQYRDRSRYYDRYDRGIGASDIITGVAIIGGIAAIASALDRDGYRYGYGNRYRYRDNYRDAVNACGYEAERYGRGRVSITDVDRRGNGYRVRGVIAGSTGLIGTTVMIAMIAMIAAKRARLSPAAPTITVVCATST